MAIDGTRAYRSNAMVSWSEYEDLDEPPNAARLDPTKGHNSESEVLVVFTSDVRLRVAVVEELEGLVDCLGQQSLHRLPAIVMQGLRDGLPEVLEAEVLAPLVQLRDPDRESRWAPSYRAAI